MKYFLILLLFCSSLYADEPPGKMIILDANSTVPWKGFLIDTERAKYFRGLNEQLKLSDEKVLKLEYLQKLQEAETKYYQDNLNQTRNTLESERNSTWVKCGIFFAAGVGVSLGMIWIVYALVP